LVLVNTHKGQEQTVRKLEKYNAVKRINRNESRRFGLHGRTFKTQFLEEEIVDLVGPDAYKDLPNLCKKWKKGEMQLMILSKDETYGDISPVR
jgi:tRNA-2-methylthio-N6-dimethylallyladenosine synthase